MLETLSLKSMSGYMPKLEDALVMCGAEKQTSVAISSYEAEYYAMTPICQEVI